MTRRGAGAQATTKNDRAGLIRPDWHKNLTDRQFDDYVRYQYIALRENNYDWDTKAHAIRRANWDGGKDSFGVNHTAVWPKVVRAIRHENAYPGIWVYAHFSFAATKELGNQKLALADVRPTGLYSSSSAAIYRTFAEAAPEILQDDGRIARITIDRRLVGIRSYKLSEEDQKLYVHCDEGLVTATPFFRHIFAAAAGCKKAADRYLWRAALHYDTLQPAYDKVIAQENWKLSDELLNAVVDIRKKWSSTNA